MPHTRNLRAFCAFVTLSCALLAGASAHAETRKSFDICWSIYVGWMPWGYGADAGIIKKWADKYNIDINVVQINDYVESINQYTAGRYDGCTMTNMDALTIPAASGVDTTALIVGDFSNGNDGVVLKGQSELKAIKGQRVNLVELSVSHYLLARALESVGMSERDIKVVNTADADLVAAFNTRNVSSVVTWNPLLAEIRALPDAHVVFDSGQIPGEIIDLLVVNTQTLQQNPELGKALVGAWYEIMARMQGDEESAVAARKAMAAASGTDLKSFEGQLEKTRLFDKASDAVAFTRSDNLPATMRNVAEFSFEHGLLGEGANSAGFIGIETPAGIFGNQKNIKLRFDPGFMALAAEDKL